MLCVPVISHTIRSAEVSLLVSVQLATASVHHNNAAARDDTMLILPSLDISNSQLSVRISLRPLFNINLHSGSHKMVQRNVGSVPAALVEVGRSISVGAGVFCLGNVALLVPISSIRLLGHNIGHTEVSGSGPGYRVLPKRMGQI